MRFHAFAGLAAAAATFSLISVSIPARAQPSAQARLAPDVVAELVAAPDTPGARARLIQHFQAVAADYDAHAREHRAMAKRYRRSPSGSDGKRPGAPDTAVHCDRLADSAAGAASEARALAVAYGGGAPALPVPVHPGNTEPAGTNSADLLEATELRRLVEAAPTPESHARVARHYRALTALLEREARDHRDLAATYRAAPTAADQKRPGAPDTAVHCERLAERVSRMAGEARALANAHAQHGDER
ncbi:hypothetical protein [Luteitalea sp.]